MTKGMILGEFEQVVLLAVARLKDNAYGVSIREEIFRRTGRMTSIGAVYATLDRLKRKGFLLDMQGEPEPVRGGKAKRFFRLEPAGVRAIQLSREMMERMWEDVELRPEWEASP